MTIKNRLATLSKKLAGRVRGTSLTSWAERFKELHDKGFILGRGGKVTPHAEWADLLPEPLRSKLKELDDKDLSE